MSIFTPARRVLYAPQVIQVPYIIDRHAGVLPSYATGFALNADESEYPELWAGQLAAWIMRLGITGGKIPDLSKSKYGGTLVANSHWVSDELGYVLDFDGIGDHVQTSFYPDANTRTIIMWVKFGSISTRHIFAGVHDESDHRFYIGVGGVDGSLYFFGAGNAYKGYTAGTAHSFVIGVWYQVTLTLDGSTASYYVNGVLVDSFVYSFSGTSTDWMPLGAYRNSGVISFDFDGQMACALVYGRCLSLSEIAFISKDPLAQWRLRRRVVMVSVGVAAPTVYQELLLGVSAAASVSESDAQTMIETGKEVSANATVSCTDLKVVFELDLVVSADASVAESDTQQMVDTGKEISADASVAESDTQQMLETGKEVSAVASVSCTDLKVVFELNLEVTASGSVAATDAHTMIETGKVVTAIATPAVIDTQAMVETGLGVSADASVSCTDTMGLLAHIAAFMILRQCT